MGWYIGTEEESASIEMKSAWLATRKKTSF